MSLVHRLSLISSLLALAVTAHADTFVVDHNGGVGVDFTDIPPAITAASAGDVLLVQPGAYSAFDLDRGLTLVGFGAPRVRLALVRDLPADEIAVVVGLDPDQLRVMNCAGTVVVQEMANLIDVRVEGSADVRLRELSVQGPVGPTLDALTTLSSRVEAVQCSFRGSRGHGPSGVLFGEQGGDGVECGAGSRLHMASSLASGGKGGDTEDLTFSNSPPFNGGDGGDGLLLQLGAEAIFGRGTISAGRGGTCFFCDSCFNEGYPGNGVTLLGNLRHSGTTITAPVHSFGQFCLVQLPGVEISFGNQSTLTEPSLLDPVLELSSVPLAGQPVQLVVSGEPGDVVELHFGRSPLLSVDPATIIEKLTSGERVFKVGVLPASGVLMFAPTVPAQSNVGARYFWQAELRRPSSGELLRTNSVPLIAR